MAQNASVKWCTGWASGPVGSSNDDSTCLLLQGRWPALHKGMLFCPMSFSSCFFPKSYSQDPPMYGSCWEPSGRCVILGQSPSCSSGVGSAGTAGSVQKQGYSGMLMTLQSTAAGLCPSGPPYRYPTGGARSPNCERKLLDSPSLGLDHGFPLSSNQEQILKCLRLTKPMKRQNLAWLCVSTVLS